MEFTDVIAVTNSSVFNEIAYDEKNYYLRIKMKTGMEYIYDNVTFCTFLFYRYNFYWKYR